MKSPNQKAYQQINKLKREGKPVYALCKSHGVTYQGYHNWEKRYADQSAPAPEKAENPISIIISPAKLAETLRKGTGEVRFRLNEILPNLTEDQKKSVYEVRGRIELERLLEQQDSDEPSTWEGAPAASYDVKGDA